MCVQHLKNWYRLFSYEKSVQMALERRIVFKMLFPEDWPAISNMEMLFKKKTTLSIMENTGESI